MGLPHLPAPDGRALLRGTRVLRPIRVRVRILADHHRVHLPGVRDVMHLLRQSVCADQDRETI